jgi:hypothetical protein
MNEQSSLDKQAVDPGIPQLLSESEQLYRWLYKFIRPYLKGKVLEIESGWGSISRLFVQDGFALRISDPNIGSYEYLQNKFKGEPMIKGIHQLNLSNPMFEAAYIKFLGRFDTLVSVAKFGPDIIDPIKLVNAKKLLKVRGRLLVLLPAIIALYGESEEGFDDWRRWNRQDISSRLGKEYEVLKTHFFTISENRRSFKIRKTDDLPALVPINLYHRQVPLFRIGNCAAPNRHGLYMITIAKKVS